MEKKHHGEYHIIQNIRYHGTDHVLLLLCGKEGIGDFF